HFDYEYHKGVITFEAEPSASVKAMLNDGGYSYKPEVKAWLMPLASGHWERDRKHAKKVFWQIADAVRSEKGLPPRTWSQDQGPTPDWAVSSVEERAERVLEQARASKTERSLQRPVSREPHCGRIPFAGRQSDCSTATTVLGLAGEPPT